MHQAMYRYAGYVHMYGMEVPVSGDMPGVSARDALAHALREERQFAMVVEIYIRTQRRGTRLDDLVYRRAPRHWRPTYHIAY